MLKFLGKLAVFFVILLIFLRSLPPIPISSTVTQKQDMFTVTGEGKVTVIPDTAVISLGVTINRPSVTDAQARANVVINETTSALKALGLTEKDIKTSDYSIYPQYDYSAGATRITGYQVNVSLTVTVRDMNKINTVIDTSTQKGVNTVTGIRLTVDENRHKELLRQARKLAVEEAKAKAESLAGAANIKLGRIINVSESGTSGPPEPYLMYDKASAGIGGDRGTQIQPGSTDIVSTITLSYETL